MQHNKVFLLDGMALAYRAHFAFVSSNLKNQDGLSTGPIFGFANTIEQIIEQEKPTHIAVAWDTHAPTFRHEMDDQYKAHRPPQPEELRTGIPFIKELVANYGIQNLELDGFEADDIIGTIALVAGQEGAEVFMVTPDKDYMQLVTENVKLYKPQNAGKGFIIVDIEGVKEYFGVLPDKVCDVLALIGDTSDNIPGMPGVGKKGAPKLIDEFGSLESLIENADSIKAQKTRENIKENAVQAIKSKEMVTIHTAVPGFIGWKEYEWKGSNSAKLAEFYKKMGFRSLTSKYSNSKTEVNSITNADSGQTDLFSSQTLNETKSDLNSGFKKFDETTVNYQLIQNSNQLQSLITELSNADTFCFDTETTGVDPLKAQLVGLSFSITPTKAYYVDLVHSELIEHLVLDSLKPIFLDSQKTIIAHNLKYDLIMVEKLGYEIQNRVFDTMIAAYLIDPNQKLGMDALAEKYLNYSPISITELIGSGKSQKSMAEIDPKTVSNYACEDADITLQLYALFKEKLTEWDLNQVAYEIEFPLIQVLAHMEMTGAKIDVKLLSQLSNVMKNENHVLEHKIFEYCGETFNLNSPQQLGSILFEKLKLPSGKKTATGKYSTSEDVLSMLAVKYEIADLILQYRTLSKLKSTYIDALPKLIHPKTGRIHSDFNQHVAATGRLSSSNPNLQNIPIRTAKGREIRKAFIPEKGNVLISADYSQIELRVIADMANDEAMKQAFINKEDIHARTAKEIFHLESLQEVTADHRRKAKEVNFGIPYGVSAYGLASRLGIENNEAKGMIQQYFERFPAVKTFMGTCVQFAKENGFVTTIMGRRRPIPDIHSPNFNIRSFAERTAINSPIQGSAADLIKLAMIQFELKKKELGLKTKMILQVHDELVFESPEMEVELAVKTIKDVMENALKLSIPLEVEAGVGQNWLDAH